MGLIRAQVTACSVNDVIPVTVEQHLTFEAVVARAPGVLKRKREKSLQSTQTQSRCEASVTVRCLVTAHDSASQSVVQSNGQYNTLSAQEVHHTASGPRGGWPPDERAPSVSGGSVSSDPKKGSLVARRRPSSRLSLVASRQKKACFKGPSCLLLPF